MNSTRAPRHLHRAWWGSVALTFLLALILTFFAHPAKAFTEDQGHNLHLVPVVRRQRLRVRPKRRARHDYQRRSNHGRGSVR